MCIRDSGHYPASNPGPIASAGWVKDNIEDALLDVDAKKILLGIATYGYDWPGAVSYTHLDVYKRQGRGTFQSSPSPKAGSYPKDKMVKTSKRKFQSSPSPKAGSYMCPIKVKLAGESFQSSPSPKAGSYLQQQSQ